MVIEYSQLIRFLRNKINMIDSNSLNGLQRPRSAANSNHMSNTSFGRFFQQNSVLDEKTVAQIWRAFGSYIAKELRNGRGVAVPRFGNFTFTSAIVDLAGTTNPGERDKQVREPVFIVGKDFVSAVYIKSGMAHNKGAQVRPFDNKGVCGIVPKVKINYTEVATLCQLNKDICKSGCEQVFRFLSDKARKGEALNMEIPFVGVFIIKNNIVAIAFADEISEETRGVTAKNHYVNKLFSSSVNKHNLQLQDNIISRYNPTIGLGGAIKLTNDAESWLKSNLNINVDDLALTTSNNAEMPLPRRRLSTANAIHRGSASNIKQKSWAIKQENGLLTEQNKNLFDQISETQLIKTPNQPKRPMSAVTRGTVNSRMTNIPEVSRSRLIIIANDIYTNRQTITEIQKGEGGNLRDTLSSSEIQSLLRKIGMSIEIGVLKALLKQLGFSWNGKSCSLMGLFQKCNDFIEGRDLQQPHVQTPQQQFRTITQEMRKSSENIINKIKDLFYASKKTLYELFQECKTGSGVDSQGLKKIVSKLSGNSTPEEEIEQAFKSVANGADSLSYHEFEKIFLWKKPIGTEWETKCIRAIKEWMFKSQLSSETAFDLMLAKTNKVLQKKLTRVDFHLALSELDLKFTAPEVDGLFRSLDVNNDGELDLEEWQSRIYCDTQNPLQMIREVVIMNGLTSDDILHRMHLHAWDSPLDFNQFTEAIRKLDPSLGESQLRSLAKLLKNKDNKVDVGVLVTNLCGKEFETVDYRNKIYKKIYPQVYPHNEWKLLKLLEEADPVNDGRVEPAALKIALSKVTTDLDQETLDRFVRFLEKDTNGKINYVSFLHRMSDVANKEHNPFKSVVQRLDYFLVSNQQTSASLVKRLKEKSGASQTAKGVPVEYFGNFLKQKIDKKRNESELRKYSRFIDIDKDGFISEIDLQTCIDNLNTNAFFKNGGEALAVSSFSSQRKFFPTNETFSPERALEIAKQIKAAMIVAKISYREAFNRFDSNGNGFISFAEFSQGVDKIMTLSLPVKEKFFSFMDKKHIGVIDYPTFLDVIQSSAVSDIKRNNFTDSFDWENSIVDKIKEWIINERITVEEAFKCFDKDFDGFIMKEDLKWALMNLLKVKEEEILPTKLDRLFRLLDFYKTGKIQTSDFQRILNDQNPYATNGKMTASSTKFQQSFGGSFNATSTFDWKLSAIQQMGLIMSKKYPNLRASFDDASDYLPKMTFDQFKKFVERLHALNGFNMTEPLLQKLFAEIDPHKKGFLNETDWQNAFQPFKHNDQVLIELKNTVSCSFADSESAYQFFLSFKSASDAKKKTITKSDFEKAVMSLSGGRFSKSDIDNQWKVISFNGKFVTIDKYIFRSHFDGLAYSGNSTVTNVKTAPVGSNLKTTIVSVNSSNVQWEADIIEKLRQIMKSSSLTLEDIFKKFDEDGNGHISANEFRNAIRKLNLGLSSRDIDQIMKKVDTNGDGKIDWKEFMDKFKSSSALDERLKERAKDRMARLKELMIMHMTSPIDAFRFFDESKLGKLTYQEFSMLVIKAHEVGGDKVPAYPVIKDLFDTIDIRKDGIIDLSEWQQTFGFILEGNNKLTIKATPLAQWENTREYSKMCTLIARNRKLLKDQFDAFGQGIVTYDQAKATLEALLMPHFSSSVTDEKLRVILKVAEVSDGGALGNRVDYMRLLEVYKGRHAAPQL